MLKGFNKRITLERILQGLLYGLGTGLLAAGIAICSFLLADLTSWYHYLIAGGIGLAVLLITALVYFFTHRVKEKEVARRVDQAFNLHEKTATMVAYEGQESLLINKQREDAISNLKGKKPRKLGVRLTLLSIPIPLIGASAFTASFFTNDIVEALTIVPEEDNFDDETDDIINSIKDYVGKAQASEAFKEKLMEILEQLREDLKGDTSIPSRREKVEAAKKQVDEALDEVNTKEEIGGSLAEDPIFGAVGEAIKNADNNALKSAFDEFNTEIDDIFTTEGLLNTLDKWIDALKSALENAGVPSSDANYGVFAKLIALLQEIYDNVENKMAASDNVSSSAVTQLIHDSQEQAKQAFEEALDELSSNLVLETANEKLAADVKKLMDQLVDPRADQGGNSDENGQPGQGGNEDSGQQDGDTNQDGNQDTEGGQGDSGSSEGGQGNGNGDQGEGSGSGSGGQDQGEGDGDGQGEGASGGGGDTQYGSDDKVYTGDHGQTSYGDVIGEYQNDASDDAKGTGDGDLEGAIGDYLDELYGDAGGSGDGD